MSPGREESPGPWPLQFLALWVLRFGPELRAQVGPKEEGLSKAAVLAGGQPGAQVCSEALGTSGGRGHFTNGPWDGVSSPGAVSRKWLPAQEGEKVAASPFFTGCQLSDQCPSKGGAPWTSQISNFPGLAGAQD